ncbi:LVIS_2131 family protein [Limosilactobacillus secaliphilus]|uniref:Uncharacterized protein n=1 Tax=Limosilactobacillus secaliphilus TaxID=396268 RepID=A0A0R2I062_9LACO|nr:LVIS_2131 family protein [Limosilactobacillus secaliphilus]KRN58527.1 hypothetical protein IV45_GL000977 [Limosilactobacillus secaliphilus]
MNWNWLGWLLWIGGIAFLAWVFHYIRVKQLMLIAKEKRRFDKGLFTRYVILMIVAVVWLGAMSYFSWFRTVSVDDESQVSIHTSYHPLVLGSVKNGYYYVRADRNKGGKRAVITYTYWTKNSRNTTNSKYGTVAVSDHYLSSAAGAYPWNKKELARLDSRSGHAFAAVMTIRYRNTPINGLGVRVGRTADQYTLIRVPAANMIHMNR